MIDIPLLSLSLILSALFFCVVVFFACRQQLEDVSLMCHLVFPLEFYDSWGWDLFSLWKGTLTFQTVLCVYSNNQSLRSSLLTHIQESCATAASEKILLGVLWLTKFKWLSSLKILYRCWTSETMLHHCLHYKQTRVKLCERSSYGSSNVMPFFWVHISAA